MRKVMVVITALMLTECATITEGTTQAITVEVVPATGTCEISRQGENLGISTPEKRVVTISKSQYNLEFHCSAEGYIPRNDVLSSNLSAATVVSFFLLDFGIVDAVTGAWKKYPDRITVVLQPEPKIVAIAPHRKK